MLQIVTTRISIYPKSGGILGILLTITFLLMLLATLPMTVNGQNAPEYDEISVFLNIQKIGGADIPALIHDETVYLPIVDIFTFLKIKNVYSSQFDSISGFFINQEATYLIDKKNNRITFQNKVYDLKDNDMVKTETNLYLRLNFFGQIFGLDCVFNFRSLTVILNTKLELPIIREMRQEQMRANISKLKGEVKADTVIGRKFPVFYFGTADWSLISSQQLGGKNDTRLNLSLGTVIAGGEANLLLNYNNNTAFTEKQQQYMWRFVNNDRAVLRQVIAGKIYSQTTSSIYDPVVGFQLTNTPTTYRRSFGSYTLSDITEPNWLVELYVNNVLVDYMKADASGFYKFEVPLVYGNSQVKLKFYGPWGEEKVKEDNISIPFNFLPPKELEYNVSAGIVEDTLRSRFSRANVNYGISRRLTVGAGVEYLSSVTTGNTMPFVNTSLRLFSGLLMSGEYTYGVRAKGILSYRFPSNLQFEVNYTKYKKGQKAIIYNYLEERKVSVSIPIKRKNFAAYSRFSFNQIVLPKLKNTNAEMLLSGSIFGVSTNLTTYGLFTDFSNPYVYSNLSLAFKLPKRISLIPQCQYDHNSKKLISVKASLDKPLFKKGFLNMSYEQNFRSNTRSIEFGFRYDLSFAQTGLSFRNTNDQNTMVESARGSLLYDRKTRYIGTNNRTSVGKGSISILPFLDVNGNGHHDKGEPKAAGLQFRIDGGTIVRNDKDTTIHILDLIPYTSYFLDLDRNSFDNISWQIQSKTIKVMIDPNQFKTIEVPISIMSEATGTVFNGSKGQGRILVCFYQNSKLVGRTLTESDGYYSYLGLKPGKCTVRIDPEQLKRINMTVAPEKIEVSFAKSIDGDIKEDLDFLLTSSEESLPDTTKKTSLVVPKTDGTIQQSTVGNKPSETKNSETTAQNRTSDDTNNKTIIKNKSSEATDKKISFIGYHGDELQVGAFKNKSNAFALLEKLSKISEKPAKIIYGDLYYFVRVEGFTNPELARPLISKLEVSGLKATYSAVDKENTSIQFGEYEKEADALNTRKKLIERIDKTVTIIFENGLYKVLITGFANHDAASLYVSEMEKKGIRFNYLQWY
jgi:cell division protein FtsN